MPYHPPLHTVYLLLSSDILLSSRPATLPPRDIWCIADGWCAMGTTQVELRDMRHRSNTADIEAHSLSSTSTSNTIGKICPTSCLYQLSSPESLVWLNYASKSGNQTVNLYKLQQYARLFIKRPMITFFGSLGAIQITKLYCIV